MDTSAARKYTSSMARPRTRQRTSTALTAALAARRGTLTYVQAAAEAGLPASSLYHWETGMKLPASASLPALARWLGWTADQVLAAMASQETS